MAKTAADVAKAVLQELRIISAEETPAAADQAEVIARYQDLVQELETIGELAIDPEAIPDRFFRPIVGVTASRCAALFGVNYMPESAAMPALLRVTALPSSGAPLQLSTF